MATLVRDIERPAFLDAERAPEGQLSLGGVAAPERGTAPPPEARAASGLLSDRLRAERVAGAAVEARGPSGASAPVLTDTTRGGGATLDELLVGAWEGLAAHRSVACPVCTAEMDPRVGADGGACGGCGSQLR